MSSNYSEKSGQRQNLKELRRAELRAERLRKRKRQILIMRIIIGILAAAIIVLGIVLGTSLLKKKSGQNAQPGKAAQQRDQAQEAENTVNAVEPAGAENAADAQDGGAAQDGTAEPDNANVENGGAAEPASENAAASSASSQDAVQEAALLAAGYDYDGAISLLKTIPSYESDQNILDLISSYEETKASCVAVDVTTVPHIFYHSLVNEPSIAFSAELQGQGAADGMNAWMTTVDEFDKITQQLYDNGYVYVRLRDLVVETTDENGNVHFEPNYELMLPEGKKAIVLSVDDLSYYHSYESSSFPDHLVIDDNGDVKCHYVHPDGSEDLGDYDVVPRLNTFLKEHPDGAYKGARGLIALTGYNGVFGYRTDIDYEVQEHLVADQAAWLAAHPDFNRDTEIAEATKVADALKEEGWEFASHTWGHLSVTSHDAAGLAVDNEKWVENVQNVVGPVDTIIFAHGNDIGDWTGYSSDNDKYAYYKSAGYNFYCNVDGSVPYWVQITDDYVRQGRIDLDGYMLYNASTGGTDVIDQLIDAASVFDSRRPTPVVANGEA